MGFDGFDTIDVLKMVIFLVIASSCTVAAFARARGENALFWGGLCAFGFLLAPVLVAFVIVPKFLDASLAREQRPFWFFVSVVAWVAFLVFWIRFVVGRKRVQPNGMWSCPRCNYLNKEYALICEACEQPYSKSARTW